MIRPLTLACFLLSSLLFQAKVHARSILVPGPDDIVKRADAIFMVRLSAKDVKITAENYKDPAEFEGEVMEVLTGGDPKLVGTKIRVVLASYDFNLKTREGVKGTQGKPQLVLGKWRKEDRTIVLAYGPFSIWPMGVPAEVSPTKDLDECKRYIIHRLVEDRRRSP